MRSENPLRNLALQVALTVPLAIPVIWAAAIGNVNWFFPAFMVIVGAHYLPFTFLYGMWEYTLLAGALVSGGVWIAMTRSISKNFAIGGWVGGAVILLFALLIQVRRGRKGEGFPPAKS